MGLWIQLNETFVSIKDDTSGFGESKDLLSPVSLLHFTAVTRVKDPPTEESKLCAHILPQKSGRQKHGMAQFYDWMVINNYRNAEASSFGPGLFLLLVFVLRSGVHSELSDSPALPFYKVGAQRLSCELSYSKYIDFLIFFSPLQHATRKDVFLHRCHHGFDSGGIRT